ncbi:hypothetical protein [Rhizohabitans arisaemae]|uniref:hypothetical protein n=1 Tax=Rhizohabitans arisaemae TaxID=2720610 RepID=UPI0024B0F3AC|nr:hypothetical protein [Rhizohabitans arisaemae]
MRKDEWTISIGSRLQEELWGGEARRLRSLLDVIATHVAESYGTPITWHSEVMTAEQWTDLDAIATEMVRNRRLDDFGVVFEALGSGGVALGRRVGAPKDMIHSLWSAGLQDEWPFTASFKFHTRYLYEEGGARPLREHPVPWLVSLVCGIVEAANATEVTIGNRRLQDELWDARDPNNVWAITYVSPDVDTSGLPDTLTVYPCTAPAGGKVVVADLELAAHAPERLVHDLLLLDDRLRAHTG